MDVVQIAAALATRLAEVPGVTSAHYPPPNVIDSDDAPAVVVFIGGPEPILLEPSNATRGAMWLPRFTANLMIPYEGDTPQTFAAVDALITPIVDIFSAGHVRDVLPGLEGDLSRIWCESVYARQVIGYAGRAYYGSVFNISGKFHRRNVP